MNWKDWIITKLGGNAPAVSVSMEEIMSDPEIQQIIGETSLRELAFWTCVNKIANALTKCEFKTYRRGEKVKDLSYYRWNIAPNVNQNKASFLTKLIGQLYRNNEALVVKINDEMYVADSYTKTEYALREYIFSDVTIDNFTFGQTFYQADVLFFHLNCVNMKRVTDMLYDSYQKLIAYSFKAYLRSRGNRGILNISAKAQADKNFKTTFATMMGEYFKNFFQTENGVLPLFEGYSYTDLTNNKTYTNESTRDIKALSDDIFDYTARGFSFPPSLAKGDVQDTAKAVDEMLTFCIDPLAELLGTEINKKSYGYEGFLRGDRIIIDTTAVKHVDIFDIATPIEKLISSAVFTINDIRAVLHEPPLEDEWADQHFITKNFSTIQDLLEQMGNGSLEENTERG